MIEVISDTIQVARKEYRDDSAEFINDAMGYIRNGGGLLTFSKVFLELTEGEAKALAAICSYGPKEFKEWFYRNMGKHYLQPFEKHLDTLFQKARSLDAAVKQVQEARYTLKEITV